MTHDESLEITMECRACGFEGDDVQEFESTAIAGERFCPNCHSNQCYQIEAS